MTDPVGPDSPSKSVYSAVLIGMFGSTGEPFLYWPGMLQNDITFALSLGTDPLYYVLHT